MTTITNDLEDQTSKQTKYLWIYDLLLILVLLVGAFVRSNGLFWGEYQYLHPDERFLVWVGTDITPITSIDPITGDKNWITISEYFDTANSPLNPNNRGKEFYVYGTFPMFLTRFTAELIFNGPWSDQYNQIGFDEMTQVGRIYSAIADLSIVLLVYLVATRLFDKRIALLAAAFSALVVLQIQQSHFFTMDTFVNFFSLLAFYFAVRIQTDKKTWAVASETINQETIEVSEEVVETSGPKETPPTPRITKALKKFLLHPLFLPSIGFGIAFGIALASKLNAAPVAFLLPAAILLRIFRSPKDKRLQYLGNSIWYMLLAGLISFVIFRILQPYAFIGPGFFGIKPNPDWLAQIRELRLQASINVDFPPAMQWARRPVWFSLQNLVIWGLGLPLGILSWVGFLWAGGQILKGNWQKHALIWGWTVIFFVWQSLALNPTMRYQLPIYPTLIIFAAWAVFQLYDRGKQKDKDPESKSSRGILYRVLAVIIGGTVLLLSTAYAFGFTSIYSRPITRLEASRWIFQNIPGPINLQIQTEEGTYNQPVPFYYDHTITNQVPFITFFQPRQDGVMERIYFPHIKDNGPGDEEQTLSIKLSTTTESGEIQSTASLTENFSDSLDPRGGEFIASLDQPITLQSDQSYELNISLENEQGLIKLEGATLANEGEWDDGIPYRLDGYDPFGGIYPPDVNFNMYWEESPEKLERFLNILEKSDYIAITSSRQWGSLPRMPERFPMSTIYYRELLGCPPEKTIEWCYNVAEPGMFKGGLGFDLVKTFTSNPSLGPLSINDQFSEEAFTVYDHPKVFIFQKNSIYDPNNVVKKLSKVDFSRIVRLPPMQYESYPADMIVSESRQLTQAQNNTWSELYNTSSIINRYPILSVISWYISLSLLGLIVYPLVRTALPGLNDRGYPLSRMAGLLILTFLVWIAGSFRLPFNRTTISIALALLLLIGLLLAYRQRKELLADFRSRKRYYLVVEAIIIGFFILDLLIRYGNPDLWHPWKGGEKPMDFAYLNAVLKSNIFPPYDPWYLGGYLNYYYYGFLIVGGLVKWLGIVPSVAYNLILPTMFSLIAIGAFSIAWNLVTAKGSKSIIPDQGEHVSKNNRNIIPYIAGIAGAVGMALLGNLGTIKMFIIGFQKLASPGAEYVGMPFFTRLVWTIEGFFKAVTGATIPYSLGDWYWLPSRIIPAAGDIEPITEFPFFTVLYGDPHAHLFALPVSLLAISLALSVVLARGIWHNKLSTVIGFIFAGLVIGALRPTNTWDFPTYLLLGMIAFGYGLWRYQSNSDWSENLAILNQLPEGLRKIIRVLAGMLVLVGLAFLLYQPYAQWYALGYSKIGLWQGTRTPLHAYFLHWGLFLFVITSWLIWESIDWMANTPVSALQKLAKHKQIIWIIMIILVLLTILLGINFPDAQGLPFGNGVNVAWIALPIAAWAGILILRPALSDAKRFVLFLIGTGLVLTIMVEVIVLQGDIGRMNTVFKFYLQVWTILSISAAASLGWVLSKMPYWSPKLRNAWQIIFVLIVAGTAMYPLMATWAKITDRMAPEAPKSLDGMIYMDYATYLDDWGVMDLSEDYRAIRWLQENISDNPVIVEANLRNLYRWGSRMSIYTGLPNVVGWEWHQQQQRAILPGSWVTDRIYEIDNFYTTQDPIEAKNFLDKYNIRYIILGQQERGHYKGPGLDKFDQHNDILWKEIYKDGDTIIYEVISSSS